MLASMARECLLTYSSERHVFQAQTVDMIGESLKGLEESVSKSIADAQATMENTNVEKVVREVAVEEAEVKLRAAQAATAEKRASLDEADAAEKDARAALKAAEKLMASFEPERKEAAGTLQAAQAKLTGLKEGALAAFGELKVHDKPAPEPEQPAGAAATEAAPAEAATAAEGTA